MSNNDVHVTISVDYRGTQIVKSVTVPGGGESAATNVNRGLEAATKKIQLMVQSEQGS